MIYFLYILAGIAGGILAGMGMGGGTLLIPILTLFLDVEQHTAQAINLIAFIPMSIVVLFGLVKNKLVDFKGLALVVIPAIITSAICANFASNFQGEQIRKYFGIFLIVLGIIYLLKEVIIWIKNKKKDIDKN